MHSTTYEAGVLVVCECFEALADVL